MSTDSLYFATDRHTDFMVELREKVDAYFAQKDLSKYGNTSLVFKAIIMHGLYLVPYLLMVSGVITSTPLILLAWILMGFGMAGIGMNVMHDANHGSFSKHRRWTHFLSYTLYLLGGLPFTWRMQHNHIHHSFTNIHGHDADIEPVEILRFSPHKPLHKIHRYQHIYAPILYGLMTIMWITTKDFQQLYKYKRMGLIKKEGKSFYPLMLELILSKLGYYVVFLALPIILLPIPWYLTLLFFFIMHFIAGVLLSVIFQAAHVMPDSEYPLPNKKGEMEHNWLVHQLLVTSNYAPNNRLLTWAAGGLNYHAVHHLFPNVSHVHYKDLSPIVKEVTDKYGIRYRVQPTFIGAVGQHFLMLKLLGRE
ncbi:MAG: acyl-CoA desaturase [Bacteroidales bacterium]